MAYLIAKKTAYSIAGKAISKRCVVAPACCIEDVTGNMCGVQVTMPRTIFLTATGLPPGCQLGAFPNIYDVLGVPTLSGSALINGQSYELNLGASGLSANGTYFYANPTNIANLVPGGNPFNQNQYGFLIDSVTKEFDGTTFGIDVYLQIILNLACPFGDNVCDTPLPGVTGPTWPYNIDITTFCVQTSPLGGVSFPFFMTLFSGGSPPCPVIGCFDPNNPLPTTAIAANCCLGSEFEITQ